jgi:hypothetical protein
MKRLFAAVLLVFWIPLALFAVDMSWKRSLQKGSSEELVKAYKDLTEPRPQWKIETAGLTINRPAFKMVLGKGTLYADGSQNGAIRPLYYQGSGSISFEVSNRIERAHLKLFIGKESLHEQPVSSVLILPLGVCADLPKIPEGPLSIGGRGEYAHFKNALHAGGMNWLASVLNGTLHGAQDIAILFRMDGDVWAYVLDSTDEEEVSLRRLGNPPHVESWWWDRAVSLHMNKDGDLTPHESRREVEAKLPADVQRIDVSLQLDKSGRALDGSSATIKMRLLEPVRALTFECNPRLDVSRVTMGDGTKVPFIKEEFSRKTFFLEPYLVVMLPEGTSGDITLHVSYTGKLCLAGGGVVLLYDDSGWFPNLFDANGFKFGFTATVPKGLEAIGIGELAGHSVAVDRETFHYEMKQNVRLASFLFGKFKHTIRKVKGIRVDIALVDNALTIYMTRNQDKVAEEIADAVKRYTAMFGPIPYKTLHAGLTGGYTNQGYPSLIMLSTDVFERSKSSWPEQVVAHEVAHQWWYNQVAPLTYRDAWISESMSEFASLVCLRDRSGMDTMKKYLSHDFHTFTKLSYVRRKPYVEFGPICLGTRLYTTLDPDDSYQTIVYFKGAWMLLNLSNMALFTPGGEKGFTDACKDMIASCKGRLMSTQDVVKDFERHMKAPLEWYFKEWLESNVVPKVKVTTRVEGSRLLVKGVQDSTLTLPIPVTIAKGRNKRAKVHEYLFFLKPGGSSREFPLPFKPDKVLVDNNHYCLADYR